MRSLLLKIRSLSNVISLRVFFCTRLFPTRRRDRVFFGDFVVHDGTGNEKQAKSVCPRHKRTCYRRVQKQARVAWVSRECDRAVRQLPAAHTGLKHNATVRRQSRVSRDFRVIQLTSVCSVWFFKLSINTSSAVPAVAVVDHTRHVVTRTTERRPLRERTVQPKNAQTDHAVSQQSLRSGGGFVG